MKHSKNMIFSRDIGISNLLKWFVKQDAQTQMGILDRFESEGLGSRASPETQGHNRSKSA